MTVVAAIGAYEAGLIAGAALLAVILGVRPLRERLSRPPKRRR